MFAGAWCHPLDSARDEVLSWSDAQLIMRIAGRAFRLAAGANYQAGKRSVYPLALRLRRKLTH